MSRTYRLTSEIYYFDLVTLYLVKLQNGKECFLRHFHTSDLLHPLLAGLLLLKELALSRNVAAIAFCTCGGRR